MNRVSAIVLAAGSSTRMEGEQKLRLPWQEATIIESTLKAITSSAPYEVIIVASANTYDFLDSHFEKVVLNADAHRGMTTSIQAGIRQVSDESRGYMICLGDMPLIKKATYQALINAFSAATGTNERAIVRPAHGGKYGQPVLFSRDYREALLVHDNMDGCREIITENQSQLVVVGVDDPGILIDIDDRRTYDKLRPVSRR